jgi:hypothetical protein
MFGARLAHMCKFTYGLLTEDGFRKLLLRHVYLFQIHEVEIDGNSVVLCSCLKDTQVWGTWIEIPGKYRTVGSMFK